MRALIRFLIGLFLLPFCVAVTLTLGDMLRAARPASSSSHPLSVVGLLAGFIIWIVLYFVMPRPVRSYVLAHELTHAIWGWIMGAHIRQMRISSKGGRVALSKSNFWIELAPYFFPFYTMLVIIAYALISLFWDQQVYEPLWLGLVGLTWGLHLTFTLSALAEHQPDIQQNGRLFSYTIIYALNLLGICFWIVAVATPTLTEFVSDLFSETRAAYLATVRQILRLLTTLTP